MVGGETCGGCGWRGRGARGGGFISGGMLSVSKDTHFTHTGQKHTAHPHRRSSCLRPPSLLDHFYLSNLIYPRSRFFLIFSSFVSNLFSPPPSLLSSITLCVLLSTSSILSTFSGSVAPQRSVSAWLYPSFLPSRLPRTSRPSPCLLYVFWQPRQSFLFLFFCHGPGSTRIAQSYCGEWVCFFFFFPEWVCFSLWGDLQWQSARRGGLLPPPRDNGPDTRGWGGARRGQPLKRPCLF